MAFQYNNNEQMFVNNLTVWIFWKYRQMWKQYLHIHCTNPEMCHTLHEMQHVDKMSMEKINSTKVMFSQRSVKEIMDRVKVSSRWVLAMLWRLSAISGYFTNSLGTCSTHFCIHQGKGIAKGWFVSYRNPLPFDRVHIAISDEGTVL